MLTPSVRELTQREYQAMRDLAMTNPWIDYSVELKRLEERLGS